MYLEKKLNEVLQGKPANYILPFFWQHGEPENVLAEEIEKIHQSGIASMCIESRTHEDFCRDGWWRDFSVILREARKRGMTVWLLDDKHFPTGYANGLVGKKYPQLRKWQLIERHVDVAGPQHGALLLRPSGDQGEKNERRLLCVLAYRRAQTGESLEVEAIDLTDHVKGDFLYWDVPDGYYRVFTLYKTREGSSLPGYIDMINPESVKVLIEAVYEPHYEHYREEFGRTFAGFFSDEPCFGNCMAESYGLQAGFYNQTIGTPYMALPWRDDLLEMLSEAMGCDAKPLLAGLWFDIGEKTPGLRLAYMDIITRLYRECFCNQLGDWCRAHGVQYIGHVIEDMNCSSHLGCGAGHYFRSLDGQDMSGIDVVLQQVIPGMGRHIHTAECYGGKVDPEFFDYVLAKLAASLSNIQPRMKGNSMCEIYGAYGWAEGTPMMKWLTDFMLVRGINHFVPHAFSPRFPDPDCPPHFYARGQNPQYRDFRILMEYTNKMSHLFTDGRHKANAAILYHAEAEWSGGRFMLTQVPAKLLYEEQIDYDILSADSVLSAQVNSARKLMVNTEEFDCLIVPYAEMLPFALIRKFSELAQKGLTVIFLCDTPAKSTENLNIVPYLSGNRFLVAREENLVQVLLDKGFYDIRPSRRDPYLRFYHYIRDNTHFYMFFNESLRETENPIHLSFEGPYLFLDLMSNIQERRQTREHAVPLRLMPYQSCVLVFGDGIETFPAAPPLVLQRRIPLDQAYRIEVADMNEYPSFRTFREKSGLLDITGPDVLPDFGGMIRYTTDFVVDGKGRCLLNLGTVGETAHVKVNGHEAGARICPPYVFDITETVQGGVNTLEIEVANSLAYKVKDGFSRGLLISSSGLLGPVTLLQYVPSPERV